MSLPPPLVLGNLDCEARWHGAVLPRRVLERISAAACLMRYLFDEPIALWTPAPVDPARVIELPGAPPIALSSGPPPRGTGERAAWGACSDRAWPQETARDRHRVSVPSTIAVARAVNDRRFAAALSDQLGVAPPGARTITSLDELRQHLEERGAAASPTDQWICKAPLSAAGRDRVIATGPLSGQLDGVGPEAETARAVAHLLVRFGALTFEPWLHRAGDLGVCAVVRPGGAVEQRAPHTLLTNARGGFLGISQLPPPLSDAQRAQLTHTVSAAGAALHRAGYTGPYNLDAFLYRAASGELRLRPLCEINARISFGWVAAALAERHGFSELGFGAPPPDASKPATLLVAPEQPDDPRGDGAAWAR